MTTPKKPAAKKAPAKAKAAAPAKTPAKRGPRRTSARSKLATGAATKKSADKAAAAAKRAGARGARLSAAKRQLRDSLIMARKAQGVSNAVAAAEAGVTERTVERIIADRRGVGSPLDDSPGQLLDELAIGFRLSIGDFEAMALAWFDTNQAASLGAKKAADETRARLATLMADVGKLPTNLELFKSEMQMQRIAEEMVTMMRAVAAGEKDASEAVEFFRALVAERGRPQLTVGAS